MIHDLFTASVFVCATILMWCATLAAVRFFGQYAFRRSREIVQTGNTVTIGSPDKPVLIAAPAANQLAEPKAQPETDFAVQCGRCNTPILTKPIRTDVDGKGARHVFKCEHCGATVALKA